MMMLPSSGGLEDIKKTLFKTAMKGEWEEVVNTYKEHPEIHNAKITKSGDTALHIAVLDGQDEVVERLVEVIVKLKEGTDNDDHRHALEALAAENERGNTPLHLAAALGSTRMCKCIAKAVVNSNHLIGRRNQDSETPFFLAVLHGRKDAFLCLHYICGKNGQGYPFCRRNDGDTILHCAIAGEYFDLAYLIIHLYDKLVNSVNDQGLSPLHILASKPSAFRSGSRIRHYHKIIYHCIFVDELAHTLPRQSTLSQELEYRKETANYPQNYQTCFSFAWLLKKVFCLIVLGSGKNDPEPKSDVEDPNEHQLIHKCPIEEGHLGMGAQGHQWFPANYLTCFEAFKFLSKAMLIVFGLGSREIVKIEERKQKHVWSVQVLDELLERTSLYEYEDNGQSPQQLPTSSKDGETKPYSFEVGGHHVTFPADSIWSQQDQVGSSAETHETTSPHDNKGNINADGDHQKGQKSKMGKKETPILIAAKNGVAEMVDKILQHFPVAIHDMNSDKKNVVLLAVENRQPHVYRLLLNMKTMKDTIFRKIDMDGNSALHLAAKLGEYRPWLIPGSALQMQWEIKWYEYVKNSMPVHFFVRFNRNGNTPKDIFTETHKELVKSGGEWLTNTSESCSVVAALIATVAFATSTTVPGGTIQDKGTPTLENEPAFDVFAISSIVALCFSVTSVVMFLAILTSRYQEKDFGTSLPRKLLLGLTSLFISISSMLISFCAGHFFVLKDKLKYAALPVYAVTCLPVTIFAVAQFPLYFDLIRATFRGVPQRSYKVISP